MPDKHMTLPSVYTTSTVLILNNLPINSGQCHMKPARQPYFLLTIISFKQKIVVKLLIVNKKRPNHKNLTLSNEQ